MFWQLFVSLRYLTAKRKERFISLVNLISVLGVALGVAALIIIISVMSGFDDDLKSKIIGTYSHIEVTCDYGMKPSQDMIEEITNTPHVEAASYFLHGQALIRRGDKVTGVVLKGVAASSEARVNKLGDYIRKGSLDFGDDRIVIGSELAHKLGVDLGDSLSLISSAHVDGKNFRISGIFTSGMYDYDMNLVYVDIGEAQKLLDVKDYASGIAVRVDDAFHVADVKKALQDKLGPPNIVRTWIDSNRNFLEALKLEKTVMFIILTLIVLVACFNIASALIMTVLEKTKDIGILKAIGSSSTGIMLIFALQGGLTGLFGTALGAGMGIVMCWLLKTYKFIQLPSDVYYLDRLPVKLETQDIVVIICCSIMLSLVSTIYPAFRASRLDPVEALRYE